MAQPATYISQEQNKASTRRGLRSLVRLFMPDGRYITGNANFKASGVFCTLDDAPEITFTPINEEDVMGIGKTTVRVNDGVGIDAFQLAMKGNCQGLFVAMSGLDVGTSGPRAFIHGYEFEKEFILTYDAYAPNAPKGIQRSTIIRGLRARIPSISGLSMSSATQQMIEFYNPDATEIMPIEGQPGTMWAFEGFYDNGTTITNAAAPDGTILTFQLGDGNGSFATSVTPVAQIIDTTYGTTHPRRWFAGLWVDGVSILDDPNVTFVTATNTITFASGFAPADGARLTCAYLVDLAANPTHMPNSIFGPTSTTATDFWYPWNTWGNL